MCFAVIDVQKERPGVVEQTVGLIKSRLQEL